MINLKYLLIIIVLSLGINGHANSQVEITINGNLVNFVENPRLNQVLEIISSEQNWYWPSSKLFKLDEQSIEQNRIDLLAQLFAIPQSANSVTIQQIILQIESWKLAQHIDIDIDYDLARYKVSNNPLFEDGKYSLTLSQRPNQLYIFGAVENPYIVAYKDNQCVEDVVAQITKTEAADVDIIYAIQPDGKIRKLPVAYWNHNCQQVMPGTQLFIPLQESQWFKEISQLNQRIAELAVNRIVIE